MVTTTWALKIRRHGLYLTERGTLGNMALMARRFRTVVGAAEFRARMDAGSFYAVVKLTKRSGLDLAIHKLAHKIQSVLQQEVEATDE